MLMLSWNTLKNKTTQAEHSQSSVFVKDSNSCSTLHQIWELTSWTPFRTKTVCGTLFNWLIKSITWLMASLIELWLLSLTLLRLNKVDLFTSTTQMVHCCQPSKEILIWTSFGTWWVQHQREIKHLLLIYKLKIIHSMSPNSTLNVCHTAAN